MSDWLVWAWVIGVDVAVIGAAVFATYDRSALRDLRPQHVAAATILVVLGWQGFANVVSWIVGGNPIDALFVAFAAVQLIFVGAAAVMVLYVLRRRRWAVALGIGLGTARVLFGLLSILNGALLGAGIEGPQLLAGVALDLLGAVPPFVAVWLFLDPFLRGQLTWRATASADEAPTPDEAAIEP
jgi:hypothetical protein